MNDDDYGPDAAETSTTTQYATDEADQRTFDEWAKRLSLSADDLRTFCRHGFHYEKIPLKSSPNRRTMLAYLRRAETGPAKWIMISGLYPETLHSEPERQKRLQALYKAVVLLIKRALAYQATQAIAERSIYWDPIAEVCRELQIAPSKLSSLCKEFSGNSLSQVVDCVRAERIKKLLRKQIKAFVSNFRTHCATLGTEKAEEIDSWSVWKALKVSRRWPEFCQNTWAIELGFASYRRLYRACLATWKQTPFQMELAMIAECLTADDAKSSGEEVEEKEWVFEEIHELVKRVEIYRDENWRVDS